MKCGLNKGDMCAALSKMDCENCSFFKTRTQIEQERKAAIKRMQEKGIYERAVCKYPILVLM
jgi:hypothetical protein